MVADLNEKFALLATALTKPKGSKIVVRTLLIRPRCDEFPVFKNCMWRFAKESANGLRFGGKKARLVYDLVETI